MQHVIIGNSSAAITAIETIRRYDQAADVSVIWDENGKRPYNPTVITHMIGGHVHSRDGRYLRGEDYYERMRVELLAGSPAKAVRPDQGVVELADGRRVPYDRCLVATGAAPAIPPIEGVDPAKAHVVRTLADGDKLIGMGGRGVKAVVLGGGLVGIETANALCELGCEVALIEMLPQIMPRALDVTAAGIAQSVMEGHGIRVMTSERVESVGEKSDGTWEVNVASGETLACDIVVMAVGVRPRVEVLEGSGAELGSGIVVDERQGTTVPGVYAAGDVAESRDFFTGERIVAGVIPEAVAQAEVAASNMVGRDHRSIGVVSENGMTFFESHAASVGVLETGDGDGWQEFILHDPDQKRYRKLIVHDGQLVGAVFFNHLEPFGAYVSVLKSKLDLDGHLNELAKGQITYAHWMQWAGRQ